MLEFGIVNSITLDLDGICNLDKKRRPVSYRPFFYSFIIDIMRTYLIIFIVAFLVACSESVKPVDTAVEDQILYIGNGTEPKILTHILSLECPAQSFDGFAGRSCY